MSQTPLREPWILETQTGSALAGVINLNHQGADAAAGFHSSQDTSFLSFNQVVLVFKELVI